MNQNDKSDFSKSQEAYELQNYIVGAAIRNKLQRLRKTFSVDRSYKLFIIFSILAIPLFFVLNIEKFIILLMLITGFVSTVRYARIYSWIIGWLWEKPEGKMSFAIAASIIIAMAKSLSDQQIRHWVQTNPNQFPSSQQSLFAYASLCIIVASLTLILIVGFAASAQVKRIKNWGKSLVKMVDIFNILGFLQPTSTKAESNSASFVEIASLFFAVCFLLLTMSELDSAFGLKDRYGNSINLSEEIFVFSSFLINRKYPEGLICNNLEGEVYISFPSNELVPSRVITAKVRESPIRDGRYEYRLSFCQNSNNFLEGN